MQEKVIESKKCKQCNISFNISNKDLEFYEKISPVFETPHNLPLSGEELEQFVASSPLTRGELRGVLDLWNWKTKYLIPTPTLCPDCRQQRRLTFRNERNLYKRKCDLTWKEIISIYSPDKPYKVYSQEAWWSDDWDAMDYGTDFDFSKWFFEQYDQLLKKVPLLAIINYNSQNSLYTNYSVWNKNCYLIFSSSESEDCYYWLKCTKSNKCVDCSVVVDSDFCYELVDSSNCYFCSHLYNCENCQKSDYMINCKNCEECFLSSNLIWKKYHILNQTYDQKQYYETKNSILSDKLKLEELYDKLKKETIYNEAVFTNCEDCLWDNMINCKNVYNWYLNQFIEDSSYTYDSTKWSNFFDVNNCFKAEYLLELMSSMWWYNYIFWFSINDSSNIIYSSNMFYCSNCFWCVWLKNKEYCIFNKQYTKEQYEELVPKIIEHMMKPKHPSRLRGTKGEFYMESEWWEFFPSSISPFGYNETVAMDYFPINRTEASSPLTRGELRGVFDTQENSFNRSTYEPPFPKTEKIIPAEKLPENIDEIPDDILAWAIECDVTKKPFKIIKPELEFYRKYKLSIPKNHPDIRNLNRMKQRNPRKLYDRKCDKCWTDIKTTFSLDRKELVYCEKCYEGEVY